MPVTMNPRMKSSRMKAAVLVVMVSNTLAFSPGVPVPFSSTTRTLAYATRHSSAWSNTNSGRSTSLSKISLQAETGSNAEDDEIQRLKSMAAKLRAEAAALEEKQQRELAEAAERAFRKFDTDQDGTVSVKELKEGLEKLLKTELPENRVAKLMADFDKSGDGALQVDEFVTVEKFRNRLDALAREEKAQALEKQRATAAEKEAVAFLQAKLELINDREPTGTDKIVSVLPYLFPLLDGLQFARFIVLDNMDNPFALLIGILYGLYRSIPFGGFIAFFALSILSGNPTLNRLVRFNMQQAIFLDISIFFPSLLAALIGLIPGINIPPAVQVLGTDAVFFTLLGAIVYCSVSSLLGKEPDKLPLISDAVKARMPTIDMFDAEGHLKNRKGSLFDEKDKKKDDENKKD